MTRKTISALAALSITVCGCQFYIDGDASSDGPTIVEPSLLIGTWHSEGGDVLELSPTGYWLRADHETDTTWAVGRFETEFASLQNLLITDGSCGAEIGKYRWSVGDAGLELEALEEPCSSRAERMSGVFTSASGAVALPDENLLDSLDEYTWQTSGGFRQTNCLDCMETKFLRLITRADRWMLIESVSAFDSRGRLQAQCEAISDLRASPLRLADPTERIWARSLVVDSDCSTKPGTAQWIAVEATASGFSTWPLEEGFVRPDETRVTNYKPYE